MGSDVLYVRIPIPLKREIQELAYQTGMSLSKVATLVISQGLEKLTAEGKGGVGEETESASVVDE